MLLRLGLLAIHQAQRIMDSENNEAAVQIITDAHKAKNRQSSVVKHEEAEYLGTTYVKSNLHQLRQL
eukprot:SAG31_NODE_37040_length_308_cov_0.583732_1_plen_66_part_10